MARGWTSLGSGVEVTHSRRDHTASTVVRGAAAVLLVDPAWEPDELDSLADHLQVAGLTVAAGFSTHAHHDHLLWHPRFGTAPRWCSPGTAAAVREHAEELRQALGPRWPAPLLEIFARVTGLSATAVPWAGPEVELVVHDAHAPGHTALWLPAARILLAGDMLSDIELPLPQETGLDAYAEGLERLRPFVERAALLVPGHGHPTDTPMARWRVDRRYLDDVRAGRPGTDPRLANAGMADAHAQTLALLGPDGA